MFTWRMRKDKDHHHQLSCRPTRASVSFLATTTAAAQEEKRRRADPLKNNSYCLKFLVFCSLYSLTFPFIRSTFISLEQPARLTLSLTTSLENDPLRGPLTTPCRAKTFSQIAIFMLRPPNEAEWPQLWDQFLREGRLESDYRNQQQILHDPPRCPKKIALGRNPN